MEIIGQCNNNAIRPPNLIKWWFNKSRKNLNCKAVEIRKEIKAIRPPNLIKWWFNKSRKNLNCKAVEISKEIKIMA